MGEGSLTWEECWPVVEAEARRWSQAGAAIGLDRDDLTQEASIAAVQCVARWRPEGGARSTYVRTAIRNRFADVRKQALRQRRVPHDAEGRPRPEWVVCYDDCGLQSWGAFDKGRIESRQAFVVKTRYVRPTLRTLCVSRETRHRQTRVAHNADP